MNKLRSPFFSFHLLPSPLSTAPLLGVTVDLPPRGATVASGATFVVAPLVGPHTPTLLFFSAADRAAFLLQHIRSLVFRLLLGYFYHHIRSLLLASQQLRSLQVSVNFVLGSVSGSKIFDLTIWIYQPLYVSIPGIVLAIAQISGEIGGPILFL
ncbi:hypothetical protein LXL04_012364 [Taraxacum kok-saghyz]